MTTEITFFYLDFSISTYKGNPTITYLVPEMNYEPHFANFMLATGEDTQDDILFISDNQIGGGMVAYKRQQYEEGSGDDSF